MFLFGHLGIGKTLLGPISKGLPNRYLLVGTILPDLIDKPLYYGATFFSQNHGSVWSSISGSRTLGHTALFILILSSLTWIKKSKRIAALFLGSAIHLLLDAVSDALLGRDFSESLQTVILWPLLGTKFPDFPYSSLSEHLNIMDRPSLILEELIGASLLIFNSRSMTTETTVAISITEVKNKPDQGTN